VLYAVAVVVVAAAAVAILVVVVVVIQLLLLLLLHVVLLGVLSQVKQSRLQQLVDWCGGQSEFDGCLIFDECHRAKHFVPVSHSVITYYCVYSCVRDVGLLQHCHQMCNVMCPLCFTLWKVVIK